MQEERMRGIPIFALIFLISCGAGPTAPTPPVPIPPAAQEICAQYGTAQVLGGEYIVQNNVWNTTAPQCVWLEGTTAWRVASANHNKTIYGPPASYPSIYKGCHWGNCSQKNPLPIRVEQLRSATSSWATIQPQAGAYNVSYDIWFNTQAATAGQPDAAELMIWIGRRGGVLPMGSRIAVVSIGNASWEVWTAQMPTWNYIAYMRQESVARVDNLDIKRFVDDAVLRGLIRPSWHLIAAEAGFEIWQGGEGLATNSFSFTASAF